MYVTARLSYLMAASQLNFLTKEREELKRKQEDFGKCKHETHTHTHNMIILFSCYQDCTTTYWVQVKMLYMISLLYCLMQNFLFSFQSLLTSLLGFCSSKSRLFLYFIFLCSLVSLLSSLCVRFILFSQFCCFYVLCCVYFPISLYQLCHLSPRYQEDILCLFPSVYCGTIPQLSYLCVPQLFTSLLQVSSSAFDLVQFGLSSINVHFKFTPSFYVSAFWFHK